MSSKEPESNKTDETKSSSSAGTSSSSTKTIVTNLASIIRALEEAEENDNRKIALLLILCELIKSGKLSNQLGRENEERLFNSIGAHFLARLLVTRQKAPSDSCSPFIYKSLCLSILTQFCSRPDLIQDPLILTRLSAFFDILKIPVNETASSDEERSLLTNLKLDTFKYLFAVAHINWEYLCNNGLFDLLFNSIILNEAESTEYKLMGNNFDDESNEANFALVACKLVEVVFKSRSAQMAVSKMSQEKQQQFEQLPHRFAVNFAMFLSKADSAKAKFKFQLVNYVNYFLSSKTITESIVANADLSEETSTRVYSILSELFKSKHEIQLAFFLLKNFIDLFQFEYIYMKDRKFFYFVIHLLCIQTALNLENAASSGVTSKLDEVDFNLMTIYYQLLEDVIIILSTASPFDDGDEDEESEESEDDDEDEDDDDDESDDRFMGKKHTSEKSKSSNKPEQKNEPEFENVIKIVVELLESVIIYLKDELVSTNGRENKPIDKLDVRSICLISSSIRLLMCWLSHESLLEKEILDLMPRFLYFAEQIHNKDSSNDEQQINLYNFLSAGLQKIYLNLSVKKDLKKTTKKNDLVKREFETVELDEEMQRVKNMMDTCYVNMNETQSVAKN